MNRIFPQTISRDTNNKTKDAFETVGVEVRAKVERLRNKRLYIEADELARALIIINNADYNV